MEMCFYCEEAGGQFVSCKNKVIILTVLCGGMGIVFKCFNTIVNMKPDF